MMTKNCYLCSDMTHHMEALDAIRRPIVRELEEFDEFVRHHFGGKGEGLLAQMLDYVLSSRGKGLRPTIVMLSAGLNSPSGGFGKRTMLAGMLIEMIHVASLIHDDVIDESNLRRGRASVNARWQSRNAVIVGDYILARNMSLGLSSGQIDLLSHIIGNMSTLCEGEIIQSDHASKLDTTRESYFDIIHKKTASLFGTCASAGAMSVGAPQERVRSMHRFGEQLGMAFQIKDDMLDYARSSSTGKPANNDLRERKITLPLIEVLERADDGLKGEIVSALERCPEEDAVDLIQRRVDEMHGTELAGETMKGFLQRAMSELAGYGESPYRDSMMSLCTYVAERDR